MRTLLLISFLLFLGLSSCSQTLTPEDWLKQNALELKNKAGYDFTALQKAIGDKRIVAIGESSHGIGDYYHLKSALVKYLHEELGFEVIAMEGGLGDINLAWLDADTFSPAELCKHTVFGNFRAEEAKELFEHIINSRDSENPLIYTGFDTQTSSDYFKNNLQSILSDYDPAFADSLQMNFNSYYHSYQAGTRNDSIEYLRHREIFTQTSEKALGILNKHHAEITNKHQLSPFAFEVLQKTLEGFSASVALSYNRRYEASPLRDKLMVQNIEWLLESVYPNKKVIIWAHNAHIERTGPTDNSMKWMGHYLAEKYGPDYYTLGLFAYQGETYQHWTRETIPFENKDTTFVEKKMSASGKAIAFLDLTQIKQTKLTNWLFQNVDAFELENGGRVSFIPTKRFDGLINFYQVKAPTY